MRNVKSEYEEEKNVLVVDDERDIGFLMKMLLVSEGYAVTAVQNLSQAKAALQENQYFVVFLDLNLTNEFGLDLLPFINKLEYDPCIAVITAQKDKSLIDKVEESEVDYLIAKPFNKAEILNVVTEA